MSGSVSDADEPQAIEAMLDICQTIGPPRLR